MKELEDLKKEFKRIENETAAAVRAIDSSDSNGRQRIIDTIDKYQAEADVLIGRIDKPLTRIEYRGRPVFVRNHR